MDEPLEPVRTWTSDSRRCTDRFPWFGGHATDPSAPAHGFARIKEWKLVEAQEDASGHVTLALELAGEGLTPHWAHRFRARHRITIGTVLRLELEVHNDDEEAFHVRRGAALVLRSA